MTSYPGIDYGRGLVNTDGQFRYGVIHLNNVGQVWFDESIPFYGYVPDYEDLDFVEPISYYYEDDEYSAECGDDGDIFIVKSPFYTYAQFCSPCAPGAVNLMAPVSQEFQECRGYCFGHDWFEKGTAPYPVFSVETGEQIFP